MGDALLIENTAQCRLADEYDAAQERGEVRTQADIDREKFDEWVADERALFEEVADEVFYPDYDHLESTARQRRSGRVWSGDAMVRIAISVEGFEAIARTLPLGSMGYENKTNERGERLIWLDHAVVNRLRAMRGPGESYSEVILRLVESEGACAQ
jgi:hypothetical protein